MKISCSVATYLYDNDRPHQGWQYLDSYRKDIHDEVKKHYPPTRYKIKHELFIYIWEKKQDAVYSPRLATVEIERYGKTTYNISFNKVSFSYLSDQELIVCNSLIQKV